MNTIHTWGLAVVLALLLTACGDQPASKEDRSKATVEQVITAARAGNANEVAKHLVYSGRKDKDRRWKSMFDPAKDDMKDVERMIEQIKRKLGEGDFQFVDFRAERESEGEWLVWRVKTASGEAMFACLDIDGTVGLGDIY